MQSTAWNGTITIVQSSDVIGFDPTASTDTNNKNVLKNMVSRLYETDDYFNPVPVLATSYSQVDDYTWEFKIAQGVKFHDGTELTIDDVIFSLQRAKEKSSSGKTLLGPVEKFEKIDDETLRITTSTVYGSLLTALSNSACTILSQAWIEKAEAGTCSWDDVIKNGATGRYILESRDIGNACGIIAEMCDEVSVMYAGAIVEHGTLEDIFDNTRHPYTQGLFNSLPNIKDRTARLKPIRGLMPDPANLPMGCAFADRCDYATEKCRGEKPRKQWLTDSHFVQCHLYDDGKDENRL